MTYPVTKLAFAWSLLGMLTLSHAAHALSFRPVERHPTGKAPHSVASGDVDGDGVIDLVTANRVDDTASILLGDGSGGFRVRFACPVGNQPRAVALGDFNGDGWLDIVTHNVNEDQNDEPTVSILLNLGLGDGTFEDAVDSASVHEGVDYVFPRTVAPVDVDGDGALDLLLGYQGADFVAVLFGDGQGGFGDLLVLEDMFHTGFVAAARIDGDDILDVCSSGGTWHRGLGNRQFAVEPTTHQMRNAAGCTLADIDSDGDLDLLVARYIQRGEVVILENIQLPDGNTVLRPLPSSLLVGEHPEHLVATDLDGDGDVDLAVANHRGNSVTLLENTGLDSFVPAGTPAVTRGPRWIVARDLNGDGRVDLATAGFSADDVAVLLAEAPSTPLRRPATFLRGDCNGDGQVSAAATDSVFLLEFNFLGKNEPPCLAACDVNGDGEVRGRVDDALYLLNFLFLGGQKPAAPYPQCGTQPEADDALSCDAESPRCGLISAPLRQH